MDISKPLVQRKSACRNGVLCIICSRLRLACCCRSVSFPPSFPFLSVGTGEFCGKKPFPSHYAKSSRAKSTSLQLPFSFSVAAARGGGENGIWSPLLCFDHRPFGPWSKTTTLKCTRNSLWPIVIVLLCRRACGVAGKEFFLLLCGSNCRVQHFT